jgi:hypothetical protein
MNSGSAIGEARKKSFMSAVMNFASCVEMVLLRRSFVSIREAAGDEVSSK